MDVHTWHTPEDLAERLGAQKYREGWRACCPAHGGDNPSALSIKRGTDKHGNPCTLLYCHSHHCDIRDICEAMGLTLVSLFCIQPAYARVTRLQPRSHDPRIERLKFSRIPHSQDDLAQVMLESTIVQEPGFLADCPPARETMWRLVQDPARKPSLLKALIEAALPVRATLDALRAEWGSDERRDAS